MDSYGLSKLVNEKTAKAFAMRYGADIYALRIGNVIEPHEYPMFKGFLDKPMTRKRNAWSYIDARDLGQIVHLCIEKDGLGFQVFNAVNDTITTKEPTAEFLKKYVPQIPLKREMVGNEAPLSNPRSARCWASRRSTTGGNTSDAAALHAAGRDAPVLRALRRAGGAGAPHRNTVSRAHRGQ